ncbi:MAG TPA: hypothetical protein VGK19_22170 [Capsulimonadaceae bacterium]|jgi:PHD/YefM family antitoxin component YafN of YafNO toxin-antitoxin module
MIDTRQIHSMSDFIRNHKAHVARLKATGAPEVLTVNGRAEVVVLDAASYQNLMDQFHEMEAIARTRNDIKRVNSASTGAGTVLSDDEIDRRHRVVDELMAETDRLGLQ